MACYVPQDRLVHVVIVGGSIDIPIHECVEEKSGTSYGTGQPELNRVRAGRDMSVVT